MKRKLLFLEQYINDFRGEKYEIYKFIDEITLRVFYGSNLKIGNLEPKKFYNCELDFKSFKGETKIIVTKVDSETK